MTEQFQVEFVPIGTYANGRGPQEVAPAQKIRNQYAGVLIKKNGILGPVYYVNIRPKKEDDKVYQSRVGLFAGKREQEELESFEDAALRELHEETGIERDAVELKPLAMVHSWDDAYNVNIGHIYLKHYGLFHRRVSLGNIKKHIRDDNLIAEQEGRNKIGKVRKIRRLFGTFYVEWFFVPVNWARYTPELVYALIRDYDQDIGRRIWNIW